MDLPRYSLVWSRLGSIRSHLLAKDHNTPILIRLWDPSHSTKLLFQSSTLGHFDSDYEALLFLQAIHNNEHLDTTLTKAGKYVLISWYFGSLDSRHDWFQKEFHHNSGKSCNYSYLFLIHMLKGVWCLFGILLFCICFPLDLGRQLGLICRSSNRSLDQGSQVCTNGIYQIHLYLILLISIQCIQNLIIGTSNHILL